MKRKKKVENKEKEINSLVGAKLLEDEPKRFDNREKGFKEKGSGKQNPKFKFTTEDFPEL